MDLFGNDAPFVSRAAPTTSTQRQTVTSNSHGNVTATRPPQPTPKPTPTAPQAGASLIGLDFGGPAPPQPGARPAPPAATPASAAATPATNGRPDLKKSILSLYASTPAPQPVYQQQSNGFQQQQSFGGFQQGHQKQNSFGDFHQAHQQQNSTNGFHSQQATSNLDSLASLTGGLSLNNPSGQQQRPSFGNLGMQPTSPSTQQANFNGFQASTSPVLNQKSQFSSMSQPAVPPKTTAFDDLLSGGASNWASTKPSVHQQSASKSSFSASSPTNAFNVMSPITSTPATSTLGAGSGNEWSDFTSSASNSQSAKKPEDDLFSNVWK